MISNFFKLIDRLIYKNGYNIGSKIYLVIKLIDRLIYKNGYNIGSRIYLVIKYFLLDNLLGSKIYLIVHDMVF